MSDAGPLLTTPLDALHRALGARMMPFAGYEMPLQYPTGIVKEHLHTRASASLFDVSHMGQIVLSAPSGRVEDAARALERLAPADLVGLAPGRQRYTFLTNPGGGILDDLMVSNLGDRLFLVVNAANKAADEAHLRHHLDVTVDPLPDRALLALQGPKAADVLARAGCDVAGMRFMDIRETDLLGAPAIVARSGYTGEDGFEISVLAGHAEATARTLLADADVLPAGLGARDTLRLEAGLCLHGSDIDETTSPVEAGLGWAIQRDRRRGGAREGGFPGAARILAELASGPARRRMGLKPEGRAPVRGGAPLFATAEGGEPVGTVTSGGFGPSVGGPVAMGYLPQALASPGMEVHAEVRGKRLPVRVTALPFVEPGYRRT